MKGRYLPFLLLLLPVVLLCCTVDPVYTHLVIDTFAPSGTATGKTYLTLIDEGGAIVAEDDDGNPDQANHEFYSRIHITEGLLSGQTYYIEVRDDTNTGSLFYGIRVLDYDPGSDFPVLGNVTESSDSDDAIAGNGVPINPWPITIGQTYSRSISPELSDVDWFKLVLP